MSAAPSSAPTRAHDRPVAPTHRAAQVIGVVAVVIGTCEVVAGVLMWWATETDTSGDPLVGLGYLLALVAGVPGVLGLVLGGLGLWLARRTAGFVLAFFGALATVGPVLLLVPAFLPVL